MVKIQVRRGINDDLPTLDVGELGFAYDIGRLYIGAPGGNTFIATTTSGIVAAEDEPIKWDGRSEMTSPVDGDIVLTDTAGTDFGMLKLGGTTPAFPALKRHGGGFLVRNAADTGYAGITASGFLATGSGSFYWTDKSRIYSDVNGNIRLTDNAINDFGLLQFGGNSNFYPAWKRVEAQLHARLADDSDMTSIHANISVEARTEVVASPYVIPDDSTLSTYTNEGVAAEGHLNLPTAVAGRQYTFVVQNANGMQINAASGDTIRVAGSVSSLAGDVSSSTVGDVITLLAINTTEWFATSYIGTWTTA